MEPVAFAETDIDGVHYSLYALSPVSEMEPVAFAETDIDGVHYSLYALSPDKVIEHGNALLSTVLASAMGKAASGDEAAMGAALAGIMQNLGNPVIKAVINDMWSVALADGMPLGGNAWKAHFIGKSGRMVRFVVWAVGAQFTDFFVSLIAVLKEASATLKAKADAKKSAQGSPNAS